MMIDVVVIRFIDVVVNRFIDVVVINNKFIKLMKLSSATCVQHLVLTLSYVWVRCCI